MACSAAKVLSSCKCPSFHNTLKLLYYSSQCFWLSPPKHTACHVLRTHARGISAKLSSRDSEESPQKTVNLRTRRETVSGSSRRSKVERKTVEEENNDKRFRKDSRESRKERGAGKRREMCTRSSFAKVRDIMNGQVDGRGKKGGDAEVGKEKTRGGSKKNKSDPRVMDLRGRLDMCSKRGDVMGAIEVYDLAHREGIEMEQYHYTVLLYLCSSAATGVVQPAKSGSGARTLNAIDVPNESSRLGFSGLSESRKELNGNNGAAEMDFQVSHSVQKLVHHGQGSGVVGDKELKHSRVCSDLDGARNGKGNLAQISDENGRPNYQHLGNDSNNHDDCEVQISEDFKKYALKRGFEIYEKMLIDKVPMNEATLTTVARMALSMGNGDMAFDMVKQMKPLGINPRLRSYGPALSAFCSSGDIDKAFAVEKHMLDHGVHPEEPELEALLRVSVEAAKDDKVYYLLHKLRASTRKVSPSTADVIVRWFKSKAASRVGKRKWDHRFIKEAIESRGGGWHGQGWLGSGKWNLSYASIGPDGLCKCCGEKLAIIDLDPIETENFSESVASIAVKRDRDSSFQKFQKWLDYHGPFEAVVDGANVGLFSQKRFTPSRVNAVVNGIRHKLPSKKWPLIVLHNRRIKGNKMDEPVNKMLIEKWKNADALYATPTGSNDDWYWLYAAIKFKCLIVTNDEMRDHTFQLLGNDFFPKWKERHQVRFSFSDVGPLFHMPPPYSIVIQESEEGHWHIPIATDYEQETDRAWLCIVRDNSKVGVKYSTASRTEGSQLIDLTVRQATPTTQTEVTVNSDEVIHDDDENVSNSPQEVYKNLRNILSAPVFQDHCTLLSKIEAAEKRGNCVINFDI